MQRIRAGAWHSYIKNCIKVQKNAGMKYNQLIKSDIEENIL